MGSWLSQREDTVVAKGLGFVETYWLNKITKTRSPSLADGSVSGRSGNSGGVVARMKHDRLVNWIVQVLLGYMRKVVTRNQAMGLTVDKADRLTYHLKGGKTSLDEVVEVITLPKFDDKTDVQESCVLISPEVVRQLHQVVAKIAEGYCDNHFHNFEHACHVTMCCESKSQWIQGDSSATLADFPFRCRILDTHRHA